jgi:hypothetical protein
VSFEQDWNCLCISLPIPMQKAVALSGTDILWLASTPICPFDINLLPLDSFKEPKVDSLILHPVLVLRGMPLCKLFRCQRDPLDIDRSATI